MFGKTIPELLAKLIEFIRADGEKMFDSNFAWGRVGASRKWQTRAILAVRTSFHTYQGTMAAAQELWMQLQEKNREVEESFAQVRREYVQQHHYNAALMEKCLHALTDAYRLARKIKKLF